MHCGDLRVVQSLRASPQQELLFSREFRGDTLTSQGERRERRPCVCGIGDHRHEPLLNQHVDGALYALALEVDHARDAGHAQRPASQHAQYLPLASRYSVPRSDAITVSKQCAVQPENAVDDGLQALC
jgi:hypothetical protein